MIFEDAVKLMIGKKIRMGKLLREVGRFYSQSIEDSLQ